MILLLFVCLCLLVMFCLSWYYFATEISDDLIKILLLLITGYYLKLDLLKSGFSVPDSFSSDIISDLNVTM